MSNRGSYCDNCRLLLGRGTKSLEETRKQMQAGDYGAAREIYEEAKEGILTVRDVTTALERNAAIGLVQDVQNLLRVLEEGKKELSLGFPILEEQAKILAEAAKQAAIEADDLKNNYPLKV